MTSEASMTSRATSDASDALGASKGGAGSTSWIHASTTRAS
jgi:hypothetical protein